jgi:hypothetical protein
MAALLRSRQQKTRRSGAFLGADDGARTRDPQLGKLMLYQLSYVRAIGPKIPQSGLKFGPGAADYGVTREIGHPWR